MVGFDIAAVLSILMWTGIILAVVLAVLKAVDSFFLKTSEVKVTGKFYYGIPIVVAIFVFIIGCLVAAQGPGEFVENKMGSPEQVPLKTEAEIKTLNEELDTKRKVDAEKESVEKSEELREKSDALLDSLLKKETDQREQEKKGSE